MRWQRGQTLVELLVAMGLAAIMLPALLTGIVAAREGRAQESERLKATALLHEAEEAARSVREKNWTQFAINGTYYPHTSGGAWMLASGTQTVDGFTRQIAISDAQRNASGAIVDSGGTVDSSTKKVVTTVSWSTPITTSVTSTLYYQRYLNNAAWTQTTQADFTAGTVTNTAVTATNGGQVELATTPGSTSWATPTIVGGYDVASSTTDALDVFMDTTTDRAYFAVGTVLRIMNVSNPASPTSLGTYTASGVINSVYVVGNYAYLGTASDTAELTVVNVTNPASPTLAGSLNLTSTTDVTSVFVVNNYAYMGRVNSTTAGVNEFVIANVTTPTTPTLAGSLNLSSTVNSIYVSGNFAYLATSITTAEMTVMNVTNKASPTSAGTYDASGTSIATDIFAVGTTVYLAKANNTSGGELFVVNAATPSSVSLLGSYEAGANINGVYVSGNNAFLATAISTAEFRVVNVTTPSAITVVGSTNMGGASNDIFQAENYAYIASTNNTREFAIVQGTVIAGGYQTSGTFESSTLDVGASAAFNYLTFTITEPASTNIQLQIATNNDNTTWSFAGPDGTASTFYTTANAVPLNTLGRYVRYRASFTGTTSATPLLSDVSINYSP